MAIEKSYEAFDDYSDLNMTESEVASSTNNSFLKNMLDAENGFSFTP